ncbi:MAG: PAS domain-containing protein [Planctomycetota bacterium]|nr:PAS domain-containing protein [Planctomycetota bacterium]
MPAQPPPAAVKLTRRQQEVLDCLLGGLSNKEIARMLHISVHTVHNHVKAVHRAFGVSGRGELLARCLGTSAARPAGADRVDDVHAVDRVILESISDFVVRFSRDGTIEYLNRTIDHHSPDQIIGTHFLQWLTADDRDRFAALLEAAFSRGEEQRTTVIAGDEERRYTLDVLLRPAGDAGAVRSVIAIARLADPPAPDAGAGADAPGDAADVQRLRSIIEAAPDRILQVDREGVVLFVNNTSPGARPEQIIGTAVFDHILAEDHPIIRSALETAFTEGTAQEYTVRARRGDGSVRSYHSRLNPIRRGDEVMRAVIIARELDDTQDPPPA